MIIGITGGKGGTGKSTVATALAVELGKTKKVLLVDADVDCPNDHLILGIERTEITPVWQRIPLCNEDLCVKSRQCARVCKTNAIVSLKAHCPIFMYPQCNGCGACVIACAQDAISWDKKEIGKIYRGTKYGVDLLSGELKIKEPVSEGVVSALLDVMKERKSGYDIIFVDTAAGTHCDVITALEACDMALAVTEPTPLGAHDLKLILKLLKILDKKAQIVLNRSDIGERELIERISSKFSARISAEIPYSRKSIECYSQGKPVHNEYIAKLSEVMP